LNKFEIPLCFTPVFLKKHQKFNSLSPVAMIHAKNHKQMDMFHPFEHLGPKRLALLKSSWAHLELVPIFGQGGGENKVKAFMVMPPA
jgi:hypothetical protein